MDTSGGDASERWVLCFLVTGDREGVMAISAEGLVQTSLWEQPDGSQPIVSTVARFTDLSDAEQDRWNRLLDREADEW